MSFMSLIYTSGLHNAICCLYLLSVHFVTSSLLKINLCAARWLRNQTRSFYTDCQRNVTTQNQWRSQPDNLVMLCKFFCVYRPYEQSISKKMNKDNDLNLHSMTKLSGWLRYCTKLHFFIVYHTLFNHYSTLHV